MFSAVTGPLKMLQFALLKLLAILVALNSPPIQPAGLSIFMLSKSNAVYHQQLSCVILNIAEAVKEANKGSKGAQEEIEEEDDRSKCPAANLFIPRMFTLYDDLRHFYDFFCKCFAIFHRGIIPGTVV